MKRPFLSTVLIPAILLTVASPAFAEPQWIWLSKNAKPDEKVTLRAEFDVPGAVKAATLMVDRKIGVVPVLGDSDELIGVVMRSELVRTIAKLENADSAN